MSAKFANVETRIRRSVAVLSLCLFTVILVGFSSVPLGLMEPVRGCAPAETVRVPVLAYVATLVFLLAGLLFAATRPWGKWLLLTAFLATNAAMIVVKAKQCEPLLGALFELLEPFLFGALFALSFAGPWIVGPLESD